MTKSELKRKLEENHERRFREEFINSLPSPFKEWVTECQYIYSHDYFSKFNISPWPNFENGELVTKNNFSTYIYFDLDDFNDVKRVVDESNIDFGSSFVFWIGQGPVYVIDKKCYHKNLLDLCQYYHDLNWECLLISTKEFNKGILVDSYCGFLPSNRRTNVNEQVYEIVYFNK